MFQCLLDCHDKINFFNGQIGHWVISTKNRVLQTFGCTFKNLLKTVIRMQCKFIDLIFHQYYIC